MSNGHAKLAPSGAYRWMNCPGSIRLCEGMPDEESIYAKEGTAAHALAEYCLNRFVDAEKIIGQEFEEFIVDNEMAEAVQVYLDECRQYKGQTFIEQRFHLDDIHKDIYGTSDCSILSKDKKKLCVIDYKHGKGVVVEPGNNPQLMIYALGAMESYPVDMVRIVVVQPRAYHRKGPVRSWDISAKELRTWGQNVLLPHAKATEDPKAPLFAGPHCRFCKALAICPKQMEQALEVAKTDFAKPKLPDPENLSTEEISKIIGLASRFSEWADKIRAYAKCKLEQGENIPGYKLVARRANRRWVKTAKYEDLLCKHLGADAYTRKPLTIAQAEKALKGKGIKAASVKEILNGYWEKPDAGSTIVDEKDTRPALAIPIIEDFIDDADFLK